jgi:hypothetical protein
LFSVNKLTKYPIQKKHTHAIYCHSSFGPTFGCGHTINIRENSNANTRSYVRNGNIYNVPAGANGSPSILTDGSNNFQTSEIEVWSIL